MTGSGNGDGGDDGTVMIPLSKPLLHQLAEDWSPPLQLQVVLRDEGPELVFRLCNLDRYLDRLDS